MGERLFQFPDTLPEDFDLAVGQVDHGRGLVVAVTSVDEEVGLIGECLGNQVGVGHVFVGLIICFVILQRGCQERTVQFFEQRVQDVAGWDADAEGFSCLEDLRKFMAGLQNEGEGTRQVAAHQFELIVVEAGVFTGLTYIAADDGKGRAGSFLPAVFVDPLHGTGIQRIAADGIDRVGRVNDDAAVPDNRGDLLDRAEVGIFLVEGIDLHKFEQIFVFLGVKVMQISRS